MSEDAALNDIAIIGMSLRVPGARSYREYWDNLCSGRVAAEHYTDEQLRAAGVSEELIAHPDYVKVGMPLPEFDHFDAAFFGFSPKEADILDPQHRLFLEASFEALECAGIDPQDTEAQIGVFGGSGHNAYLPFNLLTNPQVTRNNDLFLLRHTGNDKDFLSTRVSYCLDLKGPSINVQTACSTSLVAVHAACQSLINGESDVALAGGCTIELPHNQGYLYRHGEILAPDGVCRPFDASASGTLFGSGVAMVVLKPLEEAQADGDYVFAVIKASAVNNDGARKAGYMAPSVEGQIAAVEEALEIADISPRSIGYVEAHGTGTPLGDPIEMAALNEVYKTAGNDRGYCGIGSVKANIGHLDTAAGCAGLIKAVLSVQSGQLVPTPGFGSPNPECGFDDSPFFVVEETRDWPAGDGPRRAAVNSLGVGGTNAHVIIEQAPEREANAAGDVLAFLPISAERTDDVVAYAKALSVGLPNGAAVADVAATLRRRQRPHDRRAGVWVGDIAGARDAFAALDAPKRCGPSGAAPRSHSCFPAADRSVRPWGAICINAANPFAALLRNVSTQRRQRLPLRCVACSSAMSSWTTRCSKPPACPYRGSSCSSMPSAARWVITE